MARFMEMIEEFATLPPLHEVARVHVLMPGDKGYKKRDTHLAKRIVEGAIGAAGKEPEWMRNARLRVERMRQGKKNGG